MGFMPSILDIWIPDVMEEMLLLRLFRPLFVVERIGGQSLRQRLGKEERKEEGPIAWEILRVCVSMFMN